MGCVRRLIVSRQRLGNIGRYGLDAPVGLARKRIQTYSTRNASPRVGALRPARHAIIVSFAAELQRISRQKSQRHPRGNHNGFAPPLARPPMPPAQCRPHWRAVRQRARPQRRRPGIRQCRRHTVGVSRQCFQSGGSIFPVIPLSRHSDSSRHSGASRHLRPTISPSFRRKPESTPYDFPVIPAQAGIYAPRRTPVFAGITAPYTNHQIENAAPRPPRQNPAKFTPIMPPSPLTNFSSRPILATVRCGEEKRSGFASAKRKVTATS